MAQTTTDVVESKTQQSAFQEIFSLISPSRRPPHPESQQHGGILRHRPTLRRSLQAAGRISAVVVPQCG
jgi:hypothetical protein